MGFSEEFEAQQEANRLIEQMGGLGGQDNPSKYESYQPPVFLTQVRQLAEVLIVRGFTFLRLEPLGDGASGPWNFVFAVRGKEPALTAKLFSEGKLSSETSQAARKYAQERINAAISDFTHQQNTR
jgi:hypothetical protein